MTYGEGWTAEDTRFEELCEGMVERHLRRRGIHDEHVLAAMLAVPRHRFVSDEQRGQAYADHPLPIADGQTISQPYIVALMTEALTLSGVERVLEIGTGSGYQTAVLAEIGVPVWTIEQSRELHRAATRILTDLGYENVRCHLGDGTLGLLQEAPFDRIIATGSLPEIPTPLLEQLVDGGIFVGPIGGFREQRLLRIVYHHDRLEKRNLGWCRFVPLVGEEGWSEFA